MVLLRDKGTALGSAGFLFEQHMSENLETAVIRQAKSSGGGPIELEVQVIKASPLVLKGLEFYALRQGMTVEEYCANAIFVYLQSDEDQPDPYGPTFED